MFHHRGSLPFRKPQPSREADLRHGISAITRLLSCRPTGRRQSTTARLPTAVKPKLTAPVALAPRPPVSHVTPHVSSPHVPLSPVANKFSPISIASSSPSLTGLASSSSLPSVFSLPASSQSSKDSARVTVLQRRIVRLQLAVKVCEDQRAKRRKFLAHTSSCRNWHSLRNVRKPIAVRPTNAGSPPDKRPVVPGVVPHRNLTLVNYSGIYGRHLSLSLGRLSSWPSLGSKVLEHTQDKSPKIQEERKKHNRLKTLTFCKFYNMTGRCRRGDDCPFYHDPYRSLRQPLSPDTAGFVATPIKLLDEQSEDEATDRLLSSKEPRGAKGLFVLSCEKNKPVVKRKTRDPSQGLKEEEHKRARTHRYHHPSPGEDSYLAGSTVASPCDATLSGERREEDYRHDATSAEHNQRKSRRYFNMGTDDELDEESDVIAD
eukprot:GHVS01044930.1.p1 GENE.GHVS01044930.1~~GHVS01044930.1.p1  ORF type:complete len:431 (+),score=67.39 GHVS01044930.1:142-1434(+)